MQSGTGITFMIFKDEQGGDELWSETQSVDVDSAGHYKVQLGAGSPCLLYTSNCDLRSRVALQPFQVGAKFRRVLIANIAIGFERFCDDTRCV